MRIVISWAGDSGRLAALALRSFCQDVIQASEPWVSDKDIMAGTFWHQELWDALTEAKAGIICLTPQAMESRWVHFEAGVIARQLREKGYVCPYLLGLKKTDVEGPLSHLHLVEADEIGTKKMIESINDVLGKGKLPDDRLGKYFETYFPRLTQELEAALATAPPKKEERSNDDKINEILLTVRDLKSDLAKKPNALTIDDLAGVPVIQGSGGQRYSAPQNIYHSSMASESGSMSSRPWHPGMISPHTSRTPVPGPETEPPQEPKRDES